MVKRKKQKEGTMKKIMFNERFGLEQTVLSGTKTMTRRICTMALHRKLENGTTETIEPDDMFIASDGTAHFQIGRNSYRLQPPYKVGEEIAIAQKYWDLRNCDAFYEALQKADPTFPLECIKDEAGCHNKMFVRADWMPHRIRIKSIKAERLQNISDEDCLREGVIKWTNCYIVAGIMEDRGKNNVCFDTPREAFAALIDRISGKGTWKRNPWVYAYEFELVR
jgi:hypothetical protein